MLAFKRTRFLLALIVSFLLIIQTQAQDNRTTKTIVADVLAQMPAEQADAYSQNMKLLTDTGEDGLLMLIDMLEAPGAKSNESVEYAISGWTNFIANHPPKKAIAKASYEKALKKPLDKQIKQFLIRQLEFIGDGDNVDCLAEFLLDEHLGSPAAQALANINTENAAQALVVALQDAHNNKQKTILINAIGKTAYAGAEDVILNILADASCEVLKNTAYVALSKVGSEQSLSVLKDATVQSNYAIDKDRSTISYIELLQKLATTNPAIVQKETEALTKYFKKNNLTNLRIATTEILMQLPGVNKDKLLQTALKEQNPVYLAKVLEFYTQSRSEKGVKSIIKATKKNKSDLVKVDLMYWLAAEKINDAAPTISKYLTDANPDVQKAATRSLAHLDQNISLPAIISLLSQTENFVLENAYEVLSAFSGDIVPSLTTGYLGFSDAGKVKALQLLGLRKANSAYDLVYIEMMASKEKKIQNQAALTLKDVASSNNLPQLFDLIEQDDISYRTEIQAAINQALSSEPTDKQLSIINQRMSKTHKTYVYYPSLANTGSPSALKTIMGGYSKSGANAQEAFNALLSIKSFDAVYPLLDIARASTDKAEISKAVDALIALIASSSHTGVVKANYLQDVMLLTQTLKQKKAIFKQLANTDSFQALLFTEQYLDDKDLKEDAAQAGMKIGLNNPQYTSDASIRILKKIEQTLSNPDAAYQREAIQKFLNDHKDVNPFVMAFNGKDLTGWKGFVTDPIKLAKMSAKELAEAQKAADEAAAKSWVVKEEGILTFTGTGKNLCTEKKYGDFEMWVDWKLLPGKEPDAGIYLRGTPQVQIWDTARVKVGAQVGSGGLYNNKVHQDKPLKVADQRVGEWNTFYIKMIGDRVTVYLNGELVTDNVVLENFWDRSQPIFPVEQIELQAHGSLVEYRNVFIKEIARPEPFRLSQQEEKEGFKVLFDGTNLFNWTGNLIDHVIEDGAIVYYPNKARRLDNPNLYTKEEYGDFIFRFEFQLTPGANNGLGIRTPQEGDAAYVGMELQILDDDAPIYNNLEDFQYHGSVYGIIPAKRGALKPVGEWNYQEVIAKGDHIKITLNGKVIVDGNIREATKNGTPDKKEHPGLFNKKGYIGFLAHDSFLKFRNIRIKNLDR